ncbi:hypothetical protein M9H77_03718 [Catharanthus roseus]|uniref:Uncharacterized protein n=1 Tax=Catharanthus roseus TaxID=4058 RepID=A0ACC0CC39_CATRO|nr:hypothetical protein M9H77_03718 [Catharanthus roseus]
MELNSNCESSNLDVMTSSFDAISSSYLFTSERNSRYALFVIISQVADLDASKLQAFSKKEINNFSKGVVASTFILFISARIMSHSTSMEHIDSIRVPIPMIISISISVARLGANGHHGRIRCLGKRISIRNYQSCSLFSKRSIEMSSILFSVKPLDKY